MRYFIVTLSVLLFYLTVPFSAFPFGKNKVNREQFRWHTLKTIHFDIYYPAGMEELAVYAAKISEKGYVYIANALQHEMTEVVPIVLYPSHIDFQENNILLQIIGEGTGGFTEAFKRRVVIPFTGSYGDFRHVLVHELAHAFQYNILFDDISGDTMSYFTYSGVPLWMMEGISEYLSIGFDETADMVMRDILYNDEYATLMDLTRLHIKSGYLLYKEGQAFFYFLEQKYGKGIIGELFRDIRDLADFDKALKVHTGKDLEELNLEWIRYFKKKYYPIVKGKKFDEEEGKQLTFHKKTRSSFNVCPAVSPDGKRLAYLTNRDIYSDITVISLDEGKKKKVKTLVRGSSTSKFEGMHLLSNYLSWSSDGKYIIFVSQSKGRDKIFMIDSTDGSILRELSFPFRAIMDPSISHNGKYITFVGQGNSSSNIYIYSLEQNTLSKITDDRFSERYPKLAKDNSFIVFSSNYNNAGDYEKDDFNIVKFDLKTRKTAILVGSEGNDIQPDLSPDGKKILYVSNRNGIYNVYEYRIEKNEENKITNVLGGTFYPRWFPEGDAIAFVAYQNLGYDIFTRKIDPEKFYSDDKKRDTIYSPVEFPAAYFNLNDSEFDRYSLKVRPDYLLFGLGGTVGYGLAGFARVSASDYLGNHRLIVTTDYLRYSEDNSDVNFDAAYYYLKNHWDYGFGIFRQKNPYGIFTLASINDLIHNAYFNTLFMNHYGAYAVASYPFSKFFRFSVRGTSSRYERDYTESSGRKDIFANLNQVSFSLNYDNVLWGYMVPLRGWRGIVKFDQAMNLSGQDFEFSTSSFDIRRYFLVGKRYVFAFRGSAGKIFGKDSEYFKYYIGGFNNLRGHPFLEYSGNNFFLGNIEFRFIFIEGIKMGFPLFFRIGGIGGVLFADFGSAWDGKYNFIDKENGEFDDFKMDMGFGFRFTLYPLIILKLDYAWPYYYKSFGDRHITFSLGFEF